MSAIKKMFPYDLKDSIETNNDKRISSFLDIYCFLEENLC